MSTTTTPQFFTAHEVAVEVMAALAPILPGVKVYVSKFDGDTDDVLFKKTAATGARYDIEVEAPPEVQKMFHAMCGTQDDMTHYFHNYADTFEESFEKAKLSVQMMAMDYEAFRRTGTARNGGRA